MLIRKCFVIILFISVVSCAQQPISSDQSTSRPLAFPGAEGFGKYTTGGRAGKVYIVSNLNDNGPGSLRDAIKAKGPRTIVFAVSGTIALESNLDINNGDVTIAGQSAPGDGICVKNYPVKVSANNVIIRYMRFRLGDEKRVQDDAFNGVRNKDVIIDHCSVSWATDECASFYYNENFTMQWCIISESLNESVHAKGEHGYGGIWGGIGASFHHNLIAHHNSRLPRFSGSTTVPNSKDELVDFRNNVIYNWMQNNTYGGEGGSYNVVNNYYKAGPATNVKRSERILNPSSPYGKFYVNGNVLHGNERISANNKLGIIADDIDSVFQQGAFKVESIHDQTAKEAYDVVLRFSGASLKRDDVDTRIVEEVKIGQAKFGKRKDGIIDSQEDVGGWPKLNSGDSFMDLDQDGIPDDWEKKNNLDPKNPSDGSAFTLSKGYTNLEVYLNSLIQ